MISSDSRAFMRNLANQFIQCRRVKDNGRKRGGVQESERDRQEERGKEVQERERERKQERGECRRMKDKGRKRGREVGDGKGKGDEENVG